MIYFRIRILKLLLANTCLDWDLLHRLLGPPPLPYEWLLFMIHRRRLHCTNTKSQSNFVTEPYRVVVSALAA
jgi:hypothetical protein